MYLPSDIEVRSVLSKNSQDRYIYSVKRIADTQMLWSLRASDGGWALAASDAGNEIVPIWPHEKFAALCTVKEWIGYKPESIQLNVWIDRWTPGIIKDGRLVSICPTIESRGSVISAEEFLSHLEEELVQY